MSGSSGRRRRSTPRPTLWGWLTEHWAGRLTALAGGLAGATALLAVIVVAGGSDADDAGHRALRLLVLPAALLVVVLLSALLIQAGKLLFWRNRSWTFDPETQNASGVYGIDRPRSGRRRSRKRR